MTQKTKKLERCGILAIISMIATGTIFGILAVVLAHIGIKYFTEYYLILIFPIVIGFLLGMGLSWGARIGRCCRMSVIAFLLVLGFSIISYASLLFLNFYYDSLTEKPVIVLDEYTALAEDTQHLLANLPWISDYIPQVEDSTRENLWKQLRKFTLKFPERALSPEPVVIGKIFNIALLSPVRDYLEHPGITQWNDEQEHLEFDEMLVRPWMLWSVELLFL